MHEACRSYLPYAKLFRALVFVLQAQLLLLSCFWIEQSMGPLLSVVACSIPPKLLKHVGNGVGVHCVRPLQMLVAPRCRSHLSDLGVSSARGDKCRAGFPNGCLFVDVVP